MRSDRPTRPGSREVFNITHVLQRSPTDTRTIRDSRLSRCRRKPRYRVAELELLHLLQKRQRDPTHYAKYEALRRHANGST